jgi:hypothetical protein
LKIFAGIDFLKVTLLHIIREKGVIMEQYPIRFLPLEYENNYLIIKEPYLDCMAIYCDKEGIEFQNFKDKIIVSLYGLSKNDFEKIINVIKNLRDQIVQNAIGKHYL